jgi:hypothetical protein
LDCKDINPYFAFEYVIILVLCPGQPTIEDQGIALGIDHPTPTTSACQDQKNNISDSTVLGALCIFLSPQS